MPTLVDVAQSEILLPVHWLLVDLERLPNCWKHLGLRWHTQWPLLLKPDHLLVLHHLHAHCLLYLSPRVLQSSPTYFALLLQSPGESSRPCTVSVS